MKIDELIDEIEEIGKVGSAIIQRYWEGDSREGFLTVTITCKDGIQGDIELIGEAG